MTWQNAFRDIRIDGSDITKSSFINDPTRPSMVDVVPELSVEDVDTRHGDCEHTGQ